MSASTRTAKGADRFDENLPGELRSAGGEPLFDIGRGVLLGSSCSCCGQRFFPQRPICPHCFADGTMHEVALARRGVVYASTVVRVPSSLGHRPPYAYGYVDLPEDHLRLIARFTGAPPESFAPGTAVELAFEAVARDEAGPLSAWVFHLAAA